MWTKQDESAAFDQYNATHALMMNPAEIVALVASGHYICAECERITAPGAVRRHDRRCGAVT